MEVYDQNGEILMDDINVLDPWKRDFGNYNNEPAHEMMVLIT